jgi:putative membrane protein
MSSPILTRFAAPLLAAICVVWGITGVHPPAGRLDWLLENMPAMVAACVLCITARHFTLSKWSYGWLFVHALILAYGGFYTYAKAPAGFVVQQALGLARNPYDRLGHLAQGFIPTFISREILLRRTPLRPSLALACILTSIALALSASYELLEGLTAHFVDAEAGDAFLGTQGDVWDTQWDMFCALIGGLLAQLPLFSRAHDRSMAQTRQTGAAGGR